jgi:TrmH family RNA methyltransferase
MLEKSLVKQVKALGNRQYRNETGLFLVEGTKSVLELLRSKISVKSLFATDEWIADNFKGLNGVQNVYHVNEKELSQMSKFKTPQDVIAIAQIPSYDLPEDAANEFVIVLDNIQDPGNLGTIIRIADWYGINHIVCNEQTVEWHNPKVIQASMGSFLRVKVHKTGIESYLKSQNCNIYAAVMDGQSLYETQLSAHGILLIGNEGAGVHSECLKNANHLITIPRIGHAESLNAGIATAIICDAWSRANSIFIK